MMMDQDPSNIRIPKLRKPQWALEKRVAGQFHGQVQGTGDVPPPDRVWQVYLMTWFKGKPVVVRQNETGEPLHIPIAERDPDAPVDHSAGRGKPADKADKADKAIDRWIRETARALWGIRVKDWFQTARLELTANADATEVEPGSVRYILFLCATASGLDDIPEDAGWSRRAVTRRDLVQIIREHHAEYDEVFDAAHDAYLIANAKG